METKKKFIITIRSKDSNLIQKSLQSLISSSFSSSSNDSSLSDLVDFFTATEHAEFMKVLCTLCQNLIESLSQTSVLSDESSFHENIIENNPTIDCDPIIMSLLDVTKVLTLYHDKYSTVTSEYKVQCLQHLHDILIPLNTNHGKLVKINELKTSIARLCENQFLTQSTGSEGLITQLLPYLLLVSLSPVTTDADIKRVYGLRSALDLFDFEDESIESLRGLLLRCFLQPSYLRLIEGKKFLAHVFTIQSESFSMQELILDVIKPQIIHGTRLVCLAYGDILIRAWKESINRTSMEESFQGLIHTAIHTSDRSQFKGLRLVLSMFHDLKREQEVDSLLNRLYGPFLWRSLKCANAIIRSQAAVFFFDVFPLQDPELGTEAAEHHLQFQFELLTLLLQDNDHRVRAVATSGACTILREYWEAMPPQETRKILSYLINTLSMDTSSAEVRQASIFGLVTLLDQPLSHGVLKKLLPHLSNVIHDNAEKVRFTFIQLLCKIKGIRGMHFYDIVPVPHILERLSEDSNRPKIKQVIGELLLNSFYPQDEDMVNQSGSGTESMGALRIQRCLSFIQENIQAAEAFYSTLHTLVSVGATAKMSVMLFSLFLSSIKNETQSYENDDENNSQNVDNYNHNHITKEVKRRKKPNKNSSTTFNSVSTEQLLNTKSKIEFPTIVSDPHIRIGILRVLIACLGSISNKLVQSKYSSSMELLQKHFNESNRNHFFRLFQSHSESNNLLAMDELSLCLKIISMTTAISPSKISKAAVSSKEKTSLSELSIESIYDSLLEIYSKQKLQDNGNNNDDDDNDDTERESEREQQQLSTSSSSDIIINRNNAMILSRQLKVQASMNMITSMNLMDSFLSYVETLLKQSKLLIPRTEKNKNKSLKLSMQSNSCCISLVIDILCHVFQFGYDSTLLNSSEKFPNTITFFKLIGEIVHHRMLDKNRSNSNDYENDTEMCDFQKFLALWTFVAYRHLSNGNKDYYNSLIEWTNEFFPTVSSANSLPIMLSVLLVTSDAYASGIVGNGILTIGSWIEALLYMLQNAPIGSISSRLYEKTLQVNLRLANVFVGKKYGINTETEAVVVIIERIFDVLVASAKRYPTQLPQNMTKTIQSIYKKMAISDISNNKSSSSSSSKLFEHLTAHELFLNVV